MFPIVARLALNASSGVSEYPIRLASSAMSSAAMPKMKRYMKGEPEDAADGVLVDYVSAESNRPDDFGVSSREQFTPEHF